LAAVWQFVFQPIDGRLIDGRSFSDVAKAMTKQAKAGETPALLSRAPHADRHLKS